MTPEDGEELPIKKVVAYFKNLFTSEKVTFILDGFPYDNKDLALWLTEVGSPSVVNLKVEFNELVKRTRRKN